MGFQQSDEMGRDRSTDLSQSRQVTSATGTGLLKQESPAFRAGLSGATLAGGGGRNASPGPRQFNSESNETKFDGGATASWCTLNTRCSMGVEATKSL